MQQYTVYVCPPYTFVFKRLTGRKVGDLGHQELLPEVSELVVLVQVGGHLGRGRAAAQQGSHAAHSLSCGQTLKLLHEWAWEVGGGYFWPAETQRQIHRQHGWLVVNQRNYQQGLKFILPVLDIPSTVFVFVCGFCLYVCVVPFLASRCCQMLFFLFVCFCK